MDSYSKILSNFKLFSKTDENSSSSPIPELTSPDYKHIWITILVLISLCALIYFQQEKLKTHFDNFLGKLWLGTHLTSAGELASTYVPPGFAPLSEGIMNPSGGM